MFECINCIPSIRGWKVEVQGPPRVVGCSYLKTEFELGSDHVIPTPANRCTGCEASSSQVLSGQRNDFSLSSGVRISPLVILSECGRVDSKDHRSVELGGRHILSRMNALRTSPCMLVSGGCFRRVLIKKIQYFGSLEDRKAKSHTIIWTRPLLDGLSPSLLDYATTGRVEATFLRDHIG
jgi:hypothetical protein